MQGITSETRRQSYHETRGMSVSRQIEILDILKKIKRAATAREIAGMLGYLERNAVAPRLTELYLRGLVCPSGKGKCSITGKTVTYWEITADGKNRLDGVINASND